MLSRSLYEQLHRNPELSYQEFATTNLIITQLKEYNLELVELNPTGVIASTPTNFTDTIVFRADIDGLPIEEKTPVNYSSQVPGIMHACGHDLHIASLLDFISRINFETLTINLIFVFQPAEEVDGGARIVINNDFFQQHNIKAIYGVHVWPELAYGTIGVKRDTMMATNYVFNLQLSGASSHCSTPHLGSEMIGFFSAFANYLNVINSKQTDLNQSVAINIGTINGGQQANITLADLSINGTIRALSDQQLTDVVILIENFLQANTPLYKLEYQFTKTECTYPCVENSNQLIEFHNLTPNVTNPSFAVEDFGFYKQLGPTLYSFIGCHEETQMSLHSPTFCPNPELISVISDYYLKLLGDYHA